MMQVVVDRSLCDGNGLCADIASDLFELDGNDALRILKDDLGDDEVIRARAAISICPKAALRLEHLSGLPNASGG